ncbi:hypothetical protein HHX47_DHR7000408 [Lentinula edodes]|nr:hypothetical protein HHX47_DHR7000408 [Lentinula edodes]
MSSSLTYFPFFFFFFSFFFFLPPGVVASSSFVSLSSPSSASPSISAPFKPSPGVPGAVPGAVPGVDSSGVAATVVSGAAVSSVTAFDGCVVSAVASTAGSAGTSAGSGVSVGGMLASAAVASGSLGCSGAEGTVFSAGVSVVCCVVGSGTAFSTVGSCDSTATGSTSSEVGGGSSEVSGLGDEAGTGVAALGVAAGLGVVAVRGVATLDGIFDPSLDAALGVPAGFGVPHGDFEDVGGTSAAGVVGLGGLGEEAGFGDAFVGDLTSDETVPSKSARLFVFDGADSGGPESKSDDSSEARKASFDNESMPSVEPASIIGCVARSMFISGKLIGEMTAEGALLERAVEILRFVGPMLAPVASPALVNEPHAAASRYSAAVGEGSACASSASAAGTPVPNAPGMSTADIGASSTGADGAGSGSGAGGECKISLNSLLIGDDKGVASFDLSDSAIDLAVGDTAPQTDERVSASLDDELRLLVAVLAVPILSSVGGGEGIVLSFPLYVDLPRD